MSGKHRGTTDPDRRKAALVFIWILVAGVIIAGLMFSYAVATMVTPILGGIVGLVTGGLIVWMIRHVVYLTSQS